MSVKNTICRACEKLSSLPVIGGALAPKPKVAVLRLSGVIADSALRRQSIGYARYEPLIEKAFDVYNLEAVALVINSPGGSAAQSALIAAQIRRLAEEKNKPVYAFVEDVAASGGYWLACAADEIYAQDVSIVGSIGVISASFGFEDFIERHGVKRRLHTAGKEKSLLDPFQPEKPGDVKRLKELQGDIHGAFREWVKMRRGGKLAGADKDLFEGQVWTGRTAMENGIIDDIGDLRGVMKAKFGDDIKFAEFTAEKKWLPGLLGLDQLSLSRDALETLESRAEWGRYGV